MASFVMMTLGSHAIAQETKTMTLEECRDLALKNNEEYLTSYNNYEKAKLDKSIAVKAYLPQVSGSVTGIMMSDMDMLGMTLQMRGAYMAGISLVQPIFAGGKITASNRLAEIGTEASELDYEKTRMQIIADVDNAYWTLVSVRSKVTMIEEFKAQIDSLMGQVTNMVDAQMATSNDLLRIKTNKSDIDYQLEKARNGAYLCALSLASTIGASLDTLILPVDNLSAPNMPQVPENKVEERIEYKMLQCQVDAKAEQIKVVRADYLPTVGLSGGYTYYGGIKTKGVTELADGSFYPYTQEMKDGILMAMVSVSIPILDWGSNKKKIDKAKIDLDNAELELQKNARLLTIENKQASQNLTSSYMLVKTATDGKMQADENLRVMSNKYETQMCSLTDLLQARTQWQQAASNEIEALTQYKINETEFKRISGEL